MMKTTAASIVLLLGLSGAAQSGTPPIPPIPGQGSSEARTGASAAEAAAKADILLAESEIWVSEMEAAVKGGGDGSGCPPNFSLRSFLRDSKDKKGAKEFGEGGSLGPDVPTKLEWGFYNICRSMAAKNDAPCADTLDLSWKNHLGQTVTDRDECSIAYRTLRANIAFAAKDPNFDAICREQRFMAPLNSTASLGKICDAWKNGGGDPNTIAAVMSQEAPALRKPEAAREAAQELVCAPGWRSSEDNYATLACPEYRDYRAAAAKNDAKACKGGLCRMLLGGGAAACEPYAQKMKKLLCSRFYRTKFSDDRGPLIEERLKVAEALVMGAAGKVNDLNEAQAFTERLDRVYALRDRLNSAVLVLSPLGQKPQKGAPAKAGKTP